MALADQAGDLLPQQFVALAERHLALQVQDRHIADDPFFNLHYCNSWWFVPAGRRHICSAAATADRQKRAHITVRQRDTNTKKQTASRIGAA